MSFDKLPDYEVPADQVLEPYIQQLSLRLDNASEYQLEVVIGTWLNDLVGSNQRMNPSHNWLRDSGLLNAVANGAVVMQAPIAA